MLLKDREMAALLDIANCPGRYIWKQASMAKLAEKGLVEKVGEAFGKNVYQLTDAGRKELPARAIR